jgi:hypothetical protein
MNAEAKMPMQNIPSEGAVSLVSSHPKDPVPSISHTIWARKIKNKREVGIIKKIIWRKVEVKIAKNFSFDLAAQDWDRAGKAAMAKDVPNSPMGKYWILLEKLKIAIDPTVKVEAIAVTAIRLLW